MEEQWEKPPHMLPQKEVYFIIPHSSISTETGLLKKGETRIAYRPEAQFWIQSALIAGAALDVYVARRVTSVYNKNFWPPNKLP